jgi:hypothetical protein
MAPAYGRRPDRLARSASQQLRLTLCGLCDLCVEKLRALFLLRGLETQFVPRAIRIWNGVLVTIPRTSDEKR